MGGQSAGRLTSYSMIVSRCTQPFLRAGADFLPAPAGDVELTSAARNCQQRRETDCPAVEGVAEGN